jgi:gamma-glutamylcyclotransferase (GGCT)/AIG2-like uncharacterized protein YtfP
MKRKVIPPEEAFEITPLVAVYGTLKRGYWNHFLLKGCEFLGEGYTAGRYELFDVGFPYAVPSERGFPLKVEVYRLPSPRVLKALDRLEGYPTCYLRKPERIKLKNGKELTAWIYYTFEPDGVRITKTSTDGELGLEYLEWE